MSTRLAAYLGFRDNAREAMEFYRSVFGGELTLTTFGEFEDHGDSPEGQKIMHASLETANGLVLCGSDTPTGMDLGEGSSISLALFGEDDAELRGYWDALVDDGTVTVPLESAPWGDTFGMCVDRYGTAWMVNIAPSA